MLLFSTLKSIATTIVQPFIYVGQVIHKAITVIISKVIPKRTRIHEMNLVAFTEYIDTNSNTTKSNSNSKNTSNFASDVDIESTSIFKITEDKSHHSPTSFSFAFLPPYKIKPGTMDIETGFFEVIEDDDEDVPKKEEPQPQLQPKPQVVYLKVQVPITQNQEPKVISQPKHVEKNKEEPEPEPESESKPKLEHKPEIINTSSISTVSPSPFPPRYQRRSRLDPSKEMLKTCAKNIRVGRARAKRQSILFGNSQKPGLISPMDLQANINNNNKNKNKNNNTNNNNTSHTAPNIFAQSEAAQKRILHARALRHKALFGIDIEIPDSDSEYSNSDNNSQESISPPPSTDASLEGEGNTALFEDQGITDDNGSYDDDGDFSFVTVESDSNAYTPYYTTPTKRARVIHSDNYGGFINYSHRISRNSDEMTTILEQLKQVYSNTADLTVVHALEESSLGF